MSEQKLPLLRMAYKHTPSGKVYVVWGCATHFLDKNHTEDKAIVIMCALENGKPFYYPLDKFFDVHPTTKEERFQLVVPT